MKKKVFRSLYIAIIAVALVAAIVTTDGIVRASGGGGGGNATGCDVCNKKNRSDCVCDAGGLNWVYYEFTAAGKGATFYFPGRKMVGSTDSSGTPIGAIRCNTEGFWHLGYDIQQENEINAPSGGLEWNTTGDRDGITTQWRYTSSGKHGQVGLRTNDYMSSAGAKWYWPGDSYLGFQIGIGGTTYATAKKYKENSEVEADFKSVIQGNAHAIEKLKDNGDSYNPKQYYSADEFGSVAWFCYDGDNKKTQFTATTTITSSTGPDADGRVTVNFKHTINRVSGQNFEAKNKWKTNPNYGPSKSDTWTSNNVGESKTITESVPGYIGYNGSIRICSSIDYYSEIQSNGTTTSATSNQACKTITRQSPSSNGEISVDVYGDGYNRHIGNSATYYTLSESGNGEYRIVYHDKAYRTDSVGDQISFNWWTSNTNQTLTEEGTVNKDTSGSSGYIGSNGTIVNKDMEAKGVLKYGQTVTFCNSFAWRSSMHKYSKYEKITDSLVPYRYHWGWVEHNDSYTSISGSKNGGCVTIYRPEKKCAIKNDMTYGIQHGENVGRVGVRNFNSGSGGFSYTTKPNQTYYSYNTLSYEDRNIWAMPGDTIQFKDEACAGAFYTIEANPNISGLGTHYSTAGWLTHDAAGSDGTGGGSRYFGTGSNGYLFKDQANKYRNYSTYKNPVNTSGANLAAITAATPKPYATWTTGHDGGSKEPSGRFLSQGPSNPIAEMSDQSGSASLSVPATNSPSTNDYNGTNSYKICAAAEKAGGNGCILNKQDVGGSIIHQLTWNHLTLSNSVISGNIETWAAAGIVRVPYNYYLKPYLKNPDTRGIAYLGEEKTMNPGIVVNPRKNNLVHGGATYATVTKHTTITLRAYNSSNGNRVFFSEDHSQRLNQDGSLTTYVDNTFVSGGQIKFVVPDDGTINVGDKICMELEIFPVDSHNTGNSNAVYGATQGSSDTSSGAMYALMEGAGAGAKNAIAKSCFTVAKRPTMSVESSNAYSATNKDNKPGFSTQVYAKRFGNNTSYTKHIFGSWSEYGVFGRINTSNENGKVFVSGAAVGYHENTAGRTINSVRANNSDGNNIATGDISTKTCMFATQTFVNLVGNECKTSSTIVGSDAVASYRDNIIDRYGKAGEGVDRLKAPKVGDKYNVTINSGDLEKYRIEDKNPNSIATIYAPGNAVLSGTPQFATNTNRALVINVKGTLEITGNINDERSVNKGTIGDLTGVVIIADKVWIASNVTYINATIITRDVSGAEINTCRTQDGAKMTIGTSNSDRGTLNSDRCNLTLVFDAPVFTKKIILNRTAGAGIGTSSIQRAEIFNLNMANYLWSFDQMTQYNQAVTTYSRELPTRY